MEYLGKNGGCTVYWLDFFEKNFKELPEENWLCFAMSENDPYNEQQVKSLTEFCNISIDRGIMEFKAFGKQSSKLDDFFDWIVIERKLNAQTDQDIYVMTTWHDKESLATAFWQCFYATCLPETTDYDNLKLVCTHFENIDKRSELKNYLKKFNEGWLPDE